MSRVRFVAVIFFALALPRQASAGPIDSLLPGQWYEVPNSYMKAVDPCPANDCVYSGASGQSDVVNAWNGGAYDTRRGRLILWGGGHAGYAGNEIYVFDINTLAWSRLTNPSTQPVNLADPYPDGSPNPRHTYGTPTYIPSIDRFWVNGGSIWQDGPCSAKVWMYDFTANPPESGWSLQDSSAGGVGDCGGVAAYDKVRDTVFFLGRDFNGTYLYEFNPHNLASPWTLRNNNAIRDLYMTATVDPVRRKLVVVGGISYGGSAKTLVFDIDTAGAPMKKLATSGATEIENSDAPGLAYDSATDRIVAWNGGTDVYLLNMDTLVWTKVSAAPTNSVDPGPVTASGGTWGRFQYIPSKNAYIVVNSVIRNVFFYKLAPSGPPDTTAPAAPTGLQVR